MRLYVTYSLLNSTDHHVICHVNIKRVLVNTPLPSISPCIAVSNVTFKKRGNLVTLSKAWTHLSCALLVKNRCKNMSASWTGQTYGASGASHRVNTSSSPSLFDRRRIYLSFIKVQIINYYILGQSIYRGRVCHRYIREKCCKDGNNPL